MIVYKNCPICKRRGWYAQVTTLGKCKYCGAQERYAVKDGKHVRVIVDKDWKEVK